MDRAFLNVMILSWGFMLVFTAFQTMSNIEVSDDPHVVVIVSVIIIIAHASRTSAFSPSQESGVTTPKALPRNLIHSEQKIRFHT